MIKNAGLSFPKNRVRLTNVEKIIIHHPVADWDIHRLHRFFIDDRGWNGMAYNYYQQKNGEVFYGRSTEYQEYQGAHAGWEWNRKSIGYAFEGNFDQDTMQAQQLNPSIKVLADLCEKHGLNPLTDIIGHREVSNTSCPGNNFPLNELSTRVKAEMDKRKGSGRLYRVQVGAFSDRKNAVNLADQLKKDGYDTYITQ